MRFNAFLPVASVTALTASILFVSAPAKAAFFYNSEIDFTGNADATFNPTNIIFSNASEPGTVKVTTATNAFTTNGFVGALTVPPATQGQIFDVTNPANTTVSPTQLLGFPYPSSASTPSSTGFYYNQYTKAALPNTALAYTFVGYFQNGADKTNATFSVLTAPTSNTTGTTATAYSMKLITESSPVINSVPESEPVVGILAVGVVGIGAGLKRLKKHTV